MGTDRIQDILLFTGLTFLLLLTLLLFVLVLIYVVKRIRGSLGSPVRFRLCWLPRIQPDDYYPLMVFAYAAEAGRRDAGRWQNIANYTIDRHLDARLGRKKDHYLSDDKPGKHKIPKDAVVRIRPKARGLVFSPEAATPRWDGPLLVQLFQVKAQKGFRGKTQGRIEIGLKPFFKMARLSFDVEVAEDAKLAPFKAGERPQVEMVFPSYSHKDLGKVKRAGEFYRTLNHEFTSDWNGLHAGEQWDEAIMQLIERADKFQLFWSEHTPQSKCIPQEWKYALALGKPFLPTTFVREPEQLPEEIEKLHFEFVSVDLRDWEPPRGRVSALAAESSLLLPTTVAKAGTLGPPAVLGAILAVSSVIGLQEERRLQVNEADVPGVAVEAPTPVPVPPPTPTPPPVIKHALRGRVEAPAGIPVQGLAFTISRVMRDGETPTPAWPAESIWTVRTDRGGRFTVSGLPAGIRVRVSPVTSKLVLSPRFVEVVMDSDVTVTFRDKSPNFISDILELGVVRQPDPAMVRFYERHLVSVDGVGRVLFHATLANEGKGTAKNITQRLVFPAYILFTPQPGFEKQSSDDRHQYWVLKLPELKPGKQVDFKLEGRLTKNLQPYENVYLENLKLEYEGGKPAP